MESSKVIWKGIKWKVHTQSHFYVYSFIFSYCGSEEIPLFALQIGTKGIDWVIL